MFANAQRYFNPLAVLNLAGFFYSFFANDTNVERAPRYKVTHKIIYDPQNQDQQWISGLIGYMR
jgi:hypothetical protein